MACGRSGQKTFPLWSLVVMHLSHLLLGMLICKDVPRDGLPLVSTNQSLIKSGFPLEPIWCKKEMSMNKGPIGKVIKTQRSCGFVVLMKMQTSYVLGQEMSSRAFGDLWNS